MPSNSKEYSKRYHLKKRKELHKKLGGKCYACGTRKNLIVHRIYKRPRDGEELTKLQQKIAAERAGNQSWKPMTEEEIKKVNKLLYNNTDNMVLVCRDCYKFAVRRYGRKTVIGRQKLHKLMLR